MKNNKPIKQPFTMTINTTATNTALAGYANDKCGYLKQTKNHNLSYEPNNEKTD